MNPAKRLVLIGSAAFTLLAATGGTAVAQTTASQSPVSHSVLQNSTAEKPKITTTVAGIKMTVKITAVSRATIHILTICNPAHLLPPWPGLHYVLCMNIKFKGTYLYYLGGKMGLYGVGHVQAFWAMHNSANSFRSRQGPVKWYYGGPFQTAWPGIPRQYFNKSMKSGSFVSEYFYHYFVRNGVGQYQLLREIDVQMNCGCL